MARHINTELFPFLSKESIEPTNVEPVEPVEPVEEVADVPEVADAPEPVDEVSVDDFETETYPAPSLLDEDETEIDTLD